MKTALAVFLFASTLIAQAARDITEFTLFKRSEPILVVPEVGLVLKGTDTAKQRYNVDVVIDGHKLEKKDLDIKVPFYFYVGEKSQPYELLVTKVSAGQIVGRLASPK